MGGRFAMIGTVLHDRWKIVSSLGHGGMGEVWLAEDVASGRKEALKILGASLASDPQFVSRFRREARAVNRLRHPNIIAVHDFGQLPDGRFFLSMEYADGESVQRRLKQGGAFPVARALHVLGQLAYAVHHAHSRGVVHRDLKPGNLIVVGDEGTLKILDFGVAKIVASDHAESVALSSDKLVYGTPKYMSPERVRGVGDDPRIDLYAIGCIAMELVTGAPPFMGDANAVIRGHLTTPPEVPSARRPDAGIPPELDAIILRCLAKQPEDRTQTAAELYAALMKVPGNPATGDGRRRFVPVTRRAVSPDEVRATVRYVGDAMVDLGIDDGRLVAALHAVRLTPVDEAFAELERVIDDLLPAYAHDPVVEPLAHKLALARSRR